MSTDAISWAKKQRTSSISVKCVLLVLADYADKNGHSYPSVGTLAQECDCTERTVIRNIQALEGLGLLLVTDRYTSKGRQTSNAYDLLMDHQGEGDKLSTLTGGEGDKLGGGG